jgi:ABC-type sugar transport system permease subunit
LCWPTPTLFNLSVRNSLALILIPVPLRVFGAFFLARLMQRNGRFLNWFRTAVYLPSIVPGAAFALAWLWILNPLYGPVNLLLQAMGLPTPAWLVDPNWARPALALMALWQIGEGFIVSLAALHDVPPELEDAARIDGAGSAAAPHAAAAHRPHFAAAHLPRRHLHLSGILYPRLPDDRWRPLLRHLYAAAFYL